MTKVASCETGEDEEEGDAAKAKEGKEKSLGAMFDAMMPLKSNAKGSDSENDENTGRKRRRAAAKPKPKAAPQNPEAGTICCTYASQYDYWCPRMFCQPSQAAAAKKLKQELDKAIRGCKSQFLPQSLPFQAYFLQPRTKTLALKARDTSNALHGFTGHDAIA